MKVKQMLLIGLVGLSLIGCQNTKLVEDKNTDKLQIKEEVKVEDNLEVQTEEKAEVKNEEKEIEEKPEKEQPKKEIILSQCYECGNEYPEDTMTFDGRSFHCGCIGVCSLCYATVFKGSEHYYDGSLICDNCNNNGCLNPSVDPNYYCADCGMVGTCTGGVCFNYNEDHCDICGGVWKYCQGQHDYEVFYCPECGAECGMGSCATCGWGY